MIRVSLRLRVFRHTRSFAETTKAEKVPPPCNWKVVIPKEALDIQFSRSSGPGGQNVNKRSTQVEIRFNVLEADWMPEDVKLSLNTLTLTKQNKKGELILTDQSQRTQEHNLSTCLKRLKQLVEDAKSVVNGGLTKQEEMIMKKKRNEARIR